MPLPICITQTPSVAKQYDYFGVDAAIQATGNPILAFSARLAVVDGGDALRHYWTARYIASDQISIPVRIDAESSVDMNMNYPPMIGVIGGTTVIAYVNPTGTVFRMRTSADNGVTWGAPFTPASLSGQTLKTGWGQFYKDGSTLYFFYDLLATLGLRYITSTDGVTWSSETVTNIAFGVDNTNAIWGSRKSYVFRTAAGRWIMIFNQGSFALQCSVGNVAATPATWPIGTGQYCGNASTSTVENNSGGSNIINGSISIGTDGTTFTATYQRYSPGRITHKTSIDGGASFQPFTGSGNCDNIAVGTSDSPLTENLGAPSARFVYGQHIAWVAEATIDQTYKVGPSIKSIIIANDTANLTTVLGTGSTDSVCSKGCGCPEHLPDYVAKTALVAVPRPSVFPATVGDKPIQGSAR